MTIDNQMAHRAGALAENGKVIRNGLVAVLVSPGFGAGWYSWHEGNRDFLFDPEMVAAVEAGDRDALEKRAEEIDPGGYHSTENVKIQWVPKGTLFRIDEYDGGESLVIQSEDDWIVA